MIRKNIKVLVITSIVILLPVLAGMVLWNQFPERVPTHWNAAGEIDGWNSRSFVVFGMPLILLALQWVCVIATFADPKKKNHSEKALQLVFWLVPMLSLVLHTITYVVALGITVRVELVMQLFMGFLFVVIGNFMPKIKQNYTIGIKIPWTLESEENWNKTHRFTGWLWVVCGFVMILTAFFGSMWFLLIAVFPMVLIPLIYSFVLHCKGV